MSAPRLMSAPPPLMPRPGFSWRRVAWRGSRETRTTVCSYCGKALPHDDREWGILCR